ncbi:prepilin-type N-terminal cleavage/methylation domain-containing protein [Candidatus Halobeggiatoa sp. HSG11]|nr:prepilin-type N-terminal cleavage/methylation domain-containing protein [Candidatus Halobeggiatoa sp. HSG11]
MLKQKGFTLIELMIVVAIIGILAAVAIPAYSDYIKKSKVTEASVLLSGFKTETENFYADAGHYPATIDTLVAMGLKINGTYVTDIGYTPATATAGPIACAEIDGFDDTTGTKIGTALVFGLGAGNDPVSNEWRCKPTQVTGCTTYLKDKYLPKNCRAGDGTND